MQRNIKDIIETANDVFNKLDEVYADMEELINDIENQDVKDITVRLIEIQDKI